MAGRLNQCGIRLQEEPEAELQVAEKLQTIRKRELNWPVESLRPVETVLPSQLEYA
jgi:hypothetical protein